MLFIEKSNKTNNQIFLSFQLTAAAVKDYNRGRSYLVDLAQRQEVPVFSDPKQAVECAIEKLNQCKRA